MCDLMITDAAVPPPGRDSAEWADDRSKRRKNIQYHARFGTAI